MCSYKKDGGTFICKLLNKSYEQIFPLIKFMRKQILNTFLHLSILEGIISDSVVEYDGRSVNERLVLLKREKKQLLLKGFNADPISLNYTLK